MTGPNDYYDCIGGPYDGERHEFFDDERERAIVSHGGRYERRERNGRVCMVWATGTESPEARQITRRIIREIEGEGE